MRIILAILIWVAAASLAPAAITVTPGGGGGDLAAGTVPLALTIATNVPTRGLNDRAALTPDLAVNWYYTSWYTSRSGQDAFTNAAYSAYTNVTLYCSNLFREFKTNGYWSAGWQTFDFDDFWMATAANSPSGQLTWNTNIFERGALAMSLPALIDMAHTNGFKIMLYTAVTTNGCGPNVSPIDRVYRHVQQMMSWGADGAKFDHCGLLTSETNTYYRDYYRIANQAIDDWYAMVGATNGTCRPFKIFTTGSAGEEWPNSINSDLAYGVNQTQIQPGIINYDIVSVGPWAYAGITNGMNMLRDVLQFRPFFRPGHVIYHGIGVYGNSPSCYWTNMLATAVLGCQPVEAGLGSYLGTFSSGADSWSTYYAANKAYLGTGGTEVFDMLRDPLVIPATCTLTNYLLEVFTRPLANGDTCVGICNSATTNKSNITFNYYDLGLKPDVNYTIRDVWGKKDLLTFKNAFTWTQGSQSISLLRIRESKNYEYATISPYTLTKTGWSAVSFGSDFAPFYFYEGLQQANATVNAGFSMPIPNWANKVEIVSCYYSAYAGTVAWTNTPYVSYFYPTGRRQLSTSFDPVLFPEATVICNSGTYTFVTNTFTFDVVTNAPKQVFLQSNPSTNSSGRYLVGPLNVKFME